MPDNAIAILHAALDSGADVKTTFESDCGAFAQYDVDKSW